MSRRAHKYGAKRAASALTGRSYASMTERDRAEALHLLEQGRAITDLQEQVKVELVAGISWRLDFAYREGGALVFEDVKGFETKDFKLKCKLWAAFGPAPLRIITRGKLVRTIVPTTAAEPATESA